MALLTIPEVIEVGDVSVYLSGNDNSVGSLFGKRLASPISPVEIAMATDALRWGYEGDTTDTTLRGVANYLVWMCGKYGLQGQGIISGTGGGTVVSVVTPSQPLPKQFIISGSSYIVDGQSSKTISDFIGYNLLFTRGGVAQSTIVTEPTYYSWDRNTGAFVCSPAAVTGELFQLYVI